MWADRAKAQCVAVTIQGNDSRDRSHQRKLPDPTDATGEIYDAAKRLFAELGDGRTPLRLLGASLTDPSHGDETQIALFADEQKERSRKLYRATDAIRDKYGADTVMRAGAMGSGKNVSRKHKAPIELKKREAVNIILLIPAHSSFEIVLQSVHSVGIINEQVSGIANGNS